MHTLPYQEGCQYDEGGSEPRRQAIAIQPDERANEPGGNDHRAIDQQAVDAHGPGERFPRGA